MIEFAAEERLLGVLPEPKKAGAFIPDYYRNLKPETSNNPQSGTAKRCVPFMEAITCGYIIPLWADMYVTKDGGDLSMSFPENFPMPESMGTHSYDQLPVEKFSTPGQYFKFLNPWIITTPRGVSCLFTSPLNHFESPFKLVDAIVDTDRYYNQINFPFVWAGGDGEFFIEKGTPLAHVIPFQRKTYGSVKVKKIDEKRHMKVGHILGTHLKNGYRKCFWHKKR